METSGLNELIKLAKFAGGRFDLVQAGGGNVSWKSPAGEIFIKISGISLSEMASEEQCAKLNTEQVLSILNNETLQQATSKTSRESLAQNLLKQANLMQTKRPSIETFLHVMLHPFTLHTHPIAVNHLVIRKEARTQIESLFPESVFVDYATPGIELAIKLQQEITAFVTRHSREPQIVFLKNHGLIVSANNATEVQQLTHAVVLKIEQALNIDYEHYHTSTDIAALVGKVTGTHPIAYLSEDQKIQQLWKEHPKLLQARPTSPDVFVFNGCIPCELMQLNEAELQRYFNENGFYPKVIIYQQKLFFINDTIRKAKEMEEVFKFHLLALHHGGNDIDFLPHDELLYLAGWEAEKYRQKQ